MFQSSRTCHLGMGVDFYSTLGGPLIKAPKTDKRIFYQELEKKNIGQIFA